MPLYCSGVIHVRFGTRGCSPAASADDDFRLVTPMTTRHGLVRGPLEAPAWTLVEIQLFRRKMADEIQAAATFTKTLRVTNLHEVRAARGETEISSPRDGPRRQGQAGCGATKR